jgi:anti-sigma factor RsiW
MDAPDLHPDDLDLELARTGEAAAEVSAHVAGCGECRERAGMLTLLAAELSRAEPVEIPELVEARILRQARRSAARLRSGRSRWIALAAAAALLLAVTWLLRMPPAGPSSPTDGATQVQSADINGDGKLDILDAYVLARRIESDAGSEAAWDIDDDGRVDRADVDALARIAVRIEAEVVR